MRNPASESRLRSLAKKIASRHPSADEEIIIDSDPSDNKIFSEWMAEKVYGDGESLESATDAAFYLNALYKAKRLSPNIKLSTTIAESFETVVDSVPDTTRANTLRIEQCTGYAGDVVYEDPRLVVIEPKNHRDSCCYGEKSKRRWCVSDPRDASEFGRIEQIRQYMTPVKLFIIINKLLPLSNRYSHVGAVFYRGTVDQFQRPGMTDQDYIDQARARFREQVGGDFHYTDEFLLENLSQLREAGLLMELYDTHNKMILPEDMSEYLGDDLFLNLARRP